MILMRISIVRKQISLVNVVSNNKEKLMIQK